MEGSSCIGIEWSIVCLERSVYGQTRHEVLYVGTVPCTKFKLLPEGYGAWNQPVNHYSHDWQVLKSPRSRCGKKRKVVLFAGCGLQSPSGSRPDRISTPGLKGRQPVGILAINQNL